ncbi:MAG: DUF3300 domain-containing protein [Casimicrobiaceae bacterium]
MSRRSPSYLLLALAAVATAPGLLLAQSSYGTYQPYSPGAPTYGTSTSYSGVTASAPYQQEEFDALLAPIALYPDQLLAQVLMASTFPLDVVEAARFVRQNPSVRGAALDDAVAARRWDPSVQSLAAFPQVLDMMSDRLDWTRQLGDAFIADQDRVMWTVQALRQRARAVGNLVDTQQQNVVIEDRTIIIEPVQRDVIYVPVYNPTVVFGPWWAPAYEPYYWRPSRTYYPGVVTTGVVGFGIGYLVGSSHWGWARPDWRSRRIAVDIGRPNRFIDRHPAYREYVNDGWWRHRSDARRDARDGGGFGRPPAAYVPGDRGSRPDRGPRPDGPQGRGPRRDVAAPADRVVVQPQPSRGNEAGMGPPPAASRFRDGADGGRRGEGRPAGRRDATPASNGVVVQPPPSRGNEAGMGPPAVAPQFREGGANRGEGRPAGRREVPPAANRGAPPAPALVRPPASAVAPASPGRPTARRDAPPPAPAQSVPGSGRGNEAGM